MNKFSLLFLLLFYACSPSARLAKIEARHPLEAASFCATRYPVRIIDSTREIYLPGQTVYIPGETIEADCPASPEPVKIKVPCPPSSTRVDTFNKEHHRTEESTAALEAAQLQHEQQLAAKEKALQKEKQRADRLWDGRNTWRKIGIAGMGVTALFVLLIFFKIKKLIPFF